MSGGSLDYVYSRIEECADRIQQELANEKLRYDSGKYCERHPYYIENDCKDEDFYKSDKAYSEAYIALLKNALVCMRNAAIYAHEIEWCLSCDTGPETCILECRKKLKGNKEARGIV